jgi:hypothetical protein
MVELIGANAEKQKIVLMIFVRVIKFFRRARSVFFSCLRYCRVVFWRRASPDVFSDIAEEARLKVRHPANRS